MITSEPFLKRTSSFKKAFPKIKTISVKVKHVGAVSPLLEEQFYTEHSLSGKISCPNPRCVQGGYDLQTILDHINDSNILSYKVDWDCPGHEGTPKGRKKGYPCENSVIIAFESTFAE